MPRFVLAGGVLIAGLIAGAASAGEIFVDNLAGDDLFDGRAPQPSGGVSGPVKTIARGIALIRGADSLIIANHGIPYPEPIVLAGQRFSGNPSAPFVIVGNGAVLDGSLPVPPASWVKVGDGLWRVKPWRKGTYQLILDDRPVPETTCPPHATKPPEIPVCQWAAFGGAIYYRSGPDQSPSELPFRFAALDMGISLYAIRHARIVDLKLQHFRVDGINAHDQCRGVEFTNVICTGNGRAGIAVGGSSIVTARGCDFAGNRGPSVLFDEQGVADLKESVVDKPSEAGPPQAPMNDGAAPATEANPTGT